MTSEKCRHRFVLLTFERKFRRHVALSLSNPFCQTSIENFRFWNLDIPIKNRKTTTVLYMRTTRQYIRMTSVRTLLEQRLYKSTARETFSTLHKKKKNWNLFFFCYVCVLISTRALDHFFFFKINLIKTICLYDPIVEPKQKNTGYISHGGWASGFGGKSTRHGVSLIKLSIICTPQIVANGRYEVR